MTTPAGLSTAPDERQGGAGAARRVLEAFGENLCVGQIATRLRDAFGRVSECTDRQPQDEDLYRLIYRPGLLNEPASGPPPAVWRRRMCLAIRQVFDQVPTIPNGSWVEWAATMTAIEEELCSANEEQPRIRYELALKEWLGQAADRYCSLGPVDQYQNEQRLGAALARGPHRLPPDIVDQAVDRWYLQSCLSLLGAARTEVAYAAGWLPPWLAGAFAGVVATGLLVWFVCGLTMLVGAPAGLACCCSPWCAGGLLLAMALWPRLGRVWAPRLGAVSLLGYLALLQYPEFRALNDVGWPLQPSLSLAAVAAAGLYLYQGEVRRRVRPPGLRSRPCLGRDYAAASWRLWGRCALLCAVGLAQSWMLGAIGYPLMVALGHYTTVNPPLFWVWGPPAFLIGLIVQSLWQKEAITEPI